LPVLLRVCNWLHGQASTLDDPAKSRRFIQTSQV
jgi:hypothetical protein